MEVRNTLTKPSKSSLCKVIRKIRKITKDNKMIKQELLITILNPVIRGWTAYHRHIVASKRLSVNYGTRFLRFYGVGLNADIQIKAVGGS